MCIKERVPEKDCMVQLKQSATNSGMVRTWNGSLPAENCGTGNIRLFPYVLSCGTLIHV